MKHWYLISHTGIDFHQYIDDVNIYTSLSSTAADLTQLTLFTSSLQHWLWHNRLLINPDKSALSLLCLALGNALPDRLADPRRCCWV